MKIFVSILRWLFSLMMAAAAASPGTARAADPGDLTFVEFPGTEGVSVINCRWDATGSLTVPDTYLGKPVVVVKSIAFASCAGLTSIELPDSIRSIEDGAFAGCSALSAVRFPGGDVSVGANIFNECNSLKKLVITSKSFTCKSQPFSPSGVEEFVFHPGAAVLPMWAFCNWPSLVRVSIGPGVPIIPEYAFGQCLKLSEVKLAEGLTQIGEESFVNCPSLTRIDIPPTVGHIGDGAFERSNLTQIRFKGATDIGANAFKSCRRLTEVSFGQGTRWIGPGAFSDSGLRTVWFPDSIEFLGMHSFVGMKHACRYIFRGDAPEIEGRPLGGGPLSRVLRMPRSRGFPARNFAGVRIEVGTPTLRVLDWKGRALLPGGEGISFRTVKSGGKGSIRKMRITNQGNLDLRLVGLEISGPDADDFSLVGSPAGTLGPGESTTAKVRFRPRKTGPCGAVVRFVHNDSYHRRFVIALKGRGR